MSKVAHDIPTREELLAEGWRVTFDEIIEKEVIICPPVSLEFVQHPRAPMFKNKARAKRMVNALIMRMIEQGENFVITNFVAEIYRQASLVSLWFFLKFIAGHSGPYNDINDSLHIDMCNYRQRQLKPGARGAFFVPRSCLKTTIATHGANAWEVLRDPNIRIGMVSSKLEMAEMFMHATMRIFDSNDLVRELWPDWCPELNEEGKVKDGLGWTSRVMICPARTRDMPEPTMKCAGAAGSTQGIHADLLSIDDVVGEKQLNAFHESTDEMIKITNWIESNTETLLISPIYSRVFLAATRYSLDDPYEKIMAYAFEHVGNWDGTPYIVDSSGVWSVYYRQAVERGRLIFPEKITHEFLRRLKETNYWSYMTQYMNNAHSAELSEMADYQIKEAEIDFQTGRGCSVTYQREGQPFTQNLADGEVIIGIDPAASETRATSRTSRTAIVVRFRDAYDNRVYIDGAVGYFSTVQFYDHIFRLYNKYANYVKNTYFEAGGPFKFVHGTLVEEQRKRRTYIGLRKLNPLPNKDGKIRNFLQPLLEYGKIYACHPIRDYIVDECRTFPGGHMKDTLDAMELADRYSIRPKTAEELRHLEQEKRYRSRIKNRAGW